MSTQTLIGLLLRWGCLPRPRGGLDTDSDRSAVRELLKAMLKKALGSTTIKMTFFADPKVQWHPPKVPSGRSPSHVQVCMGAMDLTSWDAAPCGYKRAVVEQLKRSGVWNKGRVDFFQACLDFAMFLPRNSRDTLRWFAVQLVWLAGMAVEEQFVAEVGDGRGAPVAKLTKTGQHKRLYKYFMAGRKVFHMPRCLHMSLDGGTLGKKQTIVGIVCLLNNQAMVFPPQVFLGRAVWLGIPYYNQNFAYYRLSGSPLFDTFVCFSPYYRICCAYYRILFANRRL